MHKIVIIGAGFGGICAVAKLSRSGNDFDLTLVDRKLTSDFLPMLPDTIGRGIKPEFLTYEIADLAKRFKAGFINAEVVSIDLEKKIVYTQSKTLDYDYLLISSGSETNFYGNENISKYAYTLDSSSDAKRIIGILQEDRFDNFIVGGGGYTGIEVATNLRVFLDKNKLDKQVMVVERAPAILGLLPDWIRKYVSDNLKRLKIDVFLNSMIKRIEGKKVYLSGGRVFQNALVIWAAGVKTAKFIQNLNVEKNPQGRIKVDEYLRLNNSAFVIGDASYFSFNNIYLRMAVQFAIFQGYCAADNIIRSIKAKALRRYRPIDLGYIIPMANNYSCARISGINLKGFPPTLFHFIMCIYRSYGCKNRLGIISGLF